MRRKGTLVSTGKFKMVGTDDSRGELKSCFFLSHIIDMLIKERALGSSPEKQSQRDVCV